MANALILTLPTPVSGTHEKFKIDPILPDSGVGALMLIDPTHPVTPWSSGIPTDNADIVNHASEQVRTLLEAPAGTQYPSKFRIGGGINNGVKGKMERTAKGAVHGIVSQATPLASGDGVAFGINTFIRDYLAANTGHRLYVSCWDRITRINPGSLGSTRSAELWIGGSSTNAGFVTMISEQGAYVTNPPPGSGSMAPTLSDNVGGFNTVGSRFSACATEVGGTAAAAATAFAGPSWGCFPATYNNAIIASRNGYWPSFAFLRMYVEDLTISGRTFAQVAAIDKALWLQETAADGRYGSDTLTAVATIP